MGDCVSGQFATAINCMDGRIQISVIEHLKKRFEADYIDEITEAGPNRIVAERAPVETFESIKRRVDVSFGKHGSHQLAIVGHEDCGGNPSPESEQIEQLHRAASVLRELYPQADIAAVWATLDGHVRDIV